MVGFVVLLRYMGEVPSAAMFHAFFHLKRSIPGLFISPLVGDTKFFKKTLTPRRIRDGDISLLILLLIGFSPPLGLLIPQSMLSILPVDVLCLSFLF